ncbi:unnamed protein product, partial [Nippostrongylus brasiliensis]|uniref:Tyrosine-protein phosphatase domain-containing protein n=1 Tax=Nippostrongylus brasiliensis TaxID=27835 RepID=A0A0N4XDG1_NIPBR
GKVSLGHSSGKVRVVVKQLAGLRRKPPITRSPTTAGVNTREYLSSKDLLADFHTRVNLHPSSFDDFLEHPNLNRFPNVLCLDRSRVKVSKKFGNGDYCHASYVDSYEEKNGYILSQAPFTSETEELFWRMIVDTKPKIILVLGSSSVIAFLNLNSLRETKDLSRNNHVQAPSGQNIQCFWPEKTSKMYSNKLKVAVVNVDKVGMNKFDKVQFQVKAIEATLKNNSGPTVLVCPSGATRCGTYAAVDITLSRINKDKRVGVKETIEIILSQRYGCFQLIEHYKTIHDIAQR